MKKILSALLGLLIAQNVYADTCAKALTGTFTSYQAVKLCATFVGTGTVSASLIPGADNSYDLGSASFQFRTAYLGTNLVFGAATAKIIPGATALAFRNHADSSTNLSLSDAGNLTFGAASAKIIPGATSLLFRNNADSATNISITDAGLIQTRNNITISDTGASHVVDITDGTITGRSRVVTGDEFYVGTTSAHKLALMTNGNRDFYLDNADGGLKQDTTNGGNIVFGKASSAVVFSAADGNTILVPQVPTMAATPVAGTNVINAGYNVVPTAAANTAAIIGAATPTPGAQFEIYNSNAANTVRIKAGGGATMNGATAGGYLALPALTSASCKTSTGGTNYDCRLNVNPTPAGP